MKITEFKGNKVVINKLIPFKGFFCINLFGFFIVRESNAKYFSDEYSQTTFMQKIITHESIHTEQMRDWFGLIGSKWRDSTINTILGGIIFYMWYFVEWIIRLITPPIKTAYKDISFEQEAYINESNPYYLNSRRPFNWMSRLFKSYRK